MFVYGILNLINLKMYIGKANDPEDRWWEHKNHARGKSMYAVHCAIRKYGPESFLFYVISSHESEKEAYDHETEVITMYGTTVDQWGYNMTKGGEGFSPTEAARENHRRGCNEPEHCRKISERHKELWQDPEYREKQIKLTAESRRKPEARQRQSEISKELWQRPESVAPIKAALKELIEDPERLAARNKAISDAYKTEEGRANKSSAMTKLWEDPDYRENLTQKRRENRQSPEAREMQSAISTAFWDTPERRARNEKIIELYKTGMRQVEIAKIVGCNPCVVNRLVKKSKENA